jgi:hypothetical protein
MEQLAGAVKGIMSREMTLGEGTNVKLGWIVGIAFSFFAAAVSVVWWAATLSTEVRGIREMITQVVAQREALASDVDDLKAWRKVMDQIGSPKVQALERSLEDRSKKLETEIRDLAERFQLHVITTSNQQRQGHIQQDDGSPLTGGTKRY